MSELTPSTWQVFKSVLASFFGVQKEETRQRDFTYGKPGQFIVIGLIITALFIAAVFVAVKVALHLTLTG
ncbi:MAG: DUF2970 domain-containing protein [Gammaproteobacteria bacterium]|nr:DUF2970 domain-containing protein [Gammaproteobacteria bacterium]